MTADAVTSDVRLRTGRSVRDRDADLTAPLRCKAYGLYSVLLGSPNETDIDAQLRDDAGVCTLRPYGIDLGELIRVYLDVGTSQRRLDYSALFEVGDSGPPVPIREQQQFSNVSGIREDLIRFYDFFDYALDERYAWAPDHMSVVLEFCHLLCFRESEASEDRLSYQLAQLDFTERHLVNWLPILVDRVDARQPASVYVRILKSLRTFLTRDHAWQASTVFEADQEK